tara:strand:+ start:1793 stop:1972 length:180 start_codon:yes stop_codon:yes gene_type:complete
MKKEDFKPHMMYKDGKGVKATTYAKHLELKKKGYGHTKPKKKKARKSFRDAVESRMGGY